MGVALAASITLTYPEEQDKGKVKLKEGSDASG
jgi:hypothetical protein